MNATGVVHLFVSGILSKNLVFCGLLGLFPLYYVGTSYRRAAIGGGVTSAAILILSIFSWTADRMFASIGLGYLLILADMAAIGACIALAAIALRTFAPAAAKTLDALVPLLIANTAVLGAALATGASTGCFGRSRPFVEAVAAAAGASIGYFVAMILMTAIRERMQISGMPRVMQGLPSTLLAAGLCSLVFLGFSAFPGF